MKRFLDARKVRLKDLIDVDENKGNNRPDRRSNLCKHAEPKQVPVAFTLLHA